jgi:hypothetical protein
MLLLWGCVRCPQGSKAPCHDNRSSKVVGPAYRRNLLQKPTLPKQVKKLSHFIKKTGVLSLFTRAATGPYLKTTSLEVRDPVYYFVAFVFRMSLWSSGKSSWLQIERSRVLFPALPDLLRNSGSRTASTHTRDDN